LFVLVLSGEAIFFLPFVLPRIFRPTYLDVFQISNLELGSFYSIYGVVAIGSYFLGGPLADRFPAYKLMSAALLLTAVGGLFLATIPAASILGLLFGYWGFTTILLFWSALLRATRMLGGRQRQGLAFGVLDGGRGAVAATVGASAVWLLSVLLPVDLESVTDVERVDAFRKVIHLFSCIVLTAAVLVFILLKPLESSLVTSDNRFRFNQLRVVLSRKAVWLQAVIILTAYSGYRVTDDFSLLVKDVLGYDEVAAAGVSTLSLWLRPVAAITAGYLADRFRASSMTVVCFVILVFSGTLFSLAPLEGNITFVVLATIATTAVAVFALRGLYFAIMDEGNIPLHVTGTAVGIASVVGYLPDIYMAPLMGYLLDAFPGTEGHQYVFALMAVLGLIGLATAVLFHGKYGASPE
jgi:MFS family permease